MTTTVKIVFLEDIRRLTLDKKAPFDALLQELKKIYPKVTGGLNFRYRDDENDLVTVTSNMELTEATETCKGTLKLRVSVRAEAKGEKAGVDAAPVESDGEFVKVSKDGQRTASITTKESKELKEAEKRAKEAETKEAEKNAEKKAAAEKAVAEKAAIDAKTKARKIIEDAEKAKKAAEKAKKAAEKATKKAKKVLEKALGAKFVKDLTIPDNMEVVVGSKVTKTWLIKNSGTVAWPKGTKFGTVDRKNGVNVIADCKVPVGLAPGQEAAISVSLTIAPKPGKYKSQEYSLVYDAKPFGHSYFAIVVAVPAADAKTAKKGPVKKVVWPVRKTKVSVQDKKAKKAAPVASSEYGAQFVKDLSIADGTVVAPGQKLVKKWLVKNTGDKAWPKGTMLVSLPKSTFGKTVKIEVKGVGKDQTVELVASLVAPQTTGPHTARFQLALPTGEKFGHKYWVNIAVSKFPNRAQLKAMFMEFISDQKVVELLQSELPTIMKEIRQGKKMASIVKMLVEKYQMLADHQFIIFVQPFLHSAEKFMQMQIDALISMYSVWAMTPFSQGAAVKAKPEAKPDVKKAAPGPEPKKKPVEESKKTIPSPKKAYKYAAQLKKFQAMGFKNLEVIKTLLNKHKGDVETVTQALFSS